MIKLIIKAKYPIEFKEGDIIFSESPVKTQVYLKKWDDNLYNMFISIDNDAIDSILYLGDLKEVRSKINKLSDAIPSIKIESDGNTWEDGLIKEIKENMARGLYDY